jgi:hypothetical protein
VPEEPKPVCRLPPPKPTLSRFVKRVGGGLRNVARTAAPIVGPAASPPAPKPDPPPAPAKGEPLPGARGRPGAQS